MSGLPLPTTEIQSSKVLYHVSLVAYAGGDLYFGARGNRYDDPHGRFNMLYLGMDLSTALMESMFHEHHWHRGVRAIQACHVRERLVREVAVIERLNVLNLNAPGAMAGRFGLNLHQLTSRDYAQTQQIAFRAHAQADVDGILYPSRNNYPGACLAMFDRAKEKLAVIDDIALDRHRLWPAFVNDYDIAIRQPVA